MDLRQMRYLVAVADEGGIRRASAARGPASRLYADEYERTVADYEREPEAILTRLWGGNVSMWREDLERSGAMD